MSGERQTRHFGETSHRARYEFASKSVRPHMQVLDVFCGNGYGSEIMAKRGAEVTAFDSFNSQKKRIGVTFIQATFPKVDLPPRYYDVAICFEAIEHVPYRMAFELVRSIRFWLKDTGTLWLSTPNDDFLKYDKVRYPYHHQHFTYPRLKELLFQTGFDHIEWFNQERKGTREFRPGPTGAYMVVKCR